MEVLLKIAFNINIDEKGECYSKAAFSHRSQSIQEPVSAGHSYSEQDCKKKTPTPSANRLKRNLWNTKPLWRNIITNVIKTSSRRQYLPSRAIDLRLRWNRKTRAKTHARTRSSNICRQRSKSCSVGNSLGSRQEIIQGTRWRMLILRWDQSVWACHRISLGRYGRIEEYIPFLDSSQMVCVGSA